MNIAAPTLAIVYRSSSNPPPPPHGAAARGACEGGAAVGVVVVSPLPGGGTRVGVHASPLRTPPPAPIAVAVLGQGLTLVHFSAQPEPFLSLKIHPKHPLNTPQKPEHPLNMPLNPPLNTP